MEESNMNSSNKRGVKMKKMNKKGFTLQQLAPIAISFVVIAIVLGIGATVVEQEDNLNVITVQ